MKHSDIELFQEKVTTCLSKHGLSVHKNAFNFSEGSFSAAQNGDYSLLSRDFLDGLKASVGAYLNPSHRFLEKPYVRSIETGPCTLNIAIVNEQSLEWYGSSNTIACFDFLHEYKNGVFSSARTFLDLGAHHGIWSVFYAKGCAARRVIAFEPSILNVTIALFNCLINGVIDVVEVVPFAVAAGEESETTVMLVDFMSLPIRSTPLNDLVLDRVDFVKVDIEGYEYEMLESPRFVELVANAKSSHFELHLGHLHGRGVLISDCVTRMKAAGISGIELYSGTELYQFLSSCDKKGFYSFLLSGTRQSHTV